MHPEAIVAQFDAPLRGWFARRVADAGDAEDLVQETLIAVIESLDRFRGEASLRTWVFAIARNQLLKYLRGVRLRPLLLPSATESVGAECGHGRLVGLEPVAVATDDDAERVAERVAVQVIVSHLPAALREVYRLFYADGLSTDAIARRLARSRGTVKYQLYEIRRRVRRALR